MSAKTLYDGKRAATERGFLSGFCNPSWSLDRPDGRASHDRCTFARCSCDCHVPDAVILPNGCPVTEQATEVLAAADYRSDAWYEARRETVSASEIAAVLGLSTWQSPFDLWWAKRTGDDSRGDTKDTKRGRRYEQLIIEDFTAEHPEFVVVHAGLCVNNERQWQACTPDGLVHEHAGMTEHRDGTFADSIGEPVAVVEAKSAARRDEWGDPGSDDIPVAYRCQVLWQMDVLGLNVAYVPVVFGFDYREYVVEYDEADVALMREAAERFLESVREDRQPDVDSHIATTRRLKRLHPELTDDEVTVPATLVRQYQAARHLKKAAEGRMRLAENRVRHLLGPAAAGVIDLGGGQTKTFSHTRSEVKERAQTVAAHTRDQINFPRKAI